MNAFTTTRIARSFVSGSPPLDATERANSSREERRGAGLPFALAAVEARIGDGRRYALRRHRHEERCVQITRNTLATSPGPADWFTGSVLVDTIATPGDVWQVGAAAVHFTPGARTAWHTHPRGQTIWVTEGVGLCQREGGPVEVIRPGDRVFFEPGENHWHGAAATRLMTHVAMQQADGDGNVVVWGEHVSEEQYGQAPSIEGGQS
jgi:quercetin dioxygenase-like cupin family protein